MFQLLDGELTSLRQAARRFERSRKLIGILVRTHGIPTYRHEGNPLAKGLDKAGLRRLKEILADYDRQPVA